MSVISGARQPTQQAVSGTEPLQSGGGEGGLLNVNKDEKQAQTDAKFGDIWKNIQAQYGEKAEKPREIKKTLGKDDFLRIMITQMKHQDPTSPFKAEQYATQLAQFTSVEQLQNLNQQMAKMTTANQPLERLAMTNMIGKVVTIDRERFVHNENVASPFQYVLPETAKSVSLNIISEAGESVFSSDLGAVKEGDHTYTWDGVKNNGQAAKSGNYFFRIEAKDASGKSIALETRGQAKVVGVSFEGQEPVLLVGDINKPQKIALRNIVRVDSNGGELSTAPQSMQKNITQLQNVSANPTSAKGQTGVSPADLNAIARAMQSNEMMGAQTDSRQALAQYQQADKNIARQNISTNNVEKLEEKGFPNGLNSGDN